MPLISIIPSATDTLCGVSLRMADASVLLRLLLIAPVLEECVVRAGVQEWLMRRLPAAPLYPVMASVAVFCLMHLGAGWQQALAVMAPGLALALLYQRTRRWRWCVLLHAGMNAAALSVCHF